MGTEDRTAEVLVRIEEATNGLSSMAESAETALQEVMRTAEKADNTLAAISFALEMAVLRNSERSYRYTSKLMLAIGLIGLITVLAYCLRQDSNLIYGWILFVLAIAMSGCIGLLIDNDVAHRRAESAQKVLQLINQGTAGSNEEDATNA